MRNARNGWIESQGQELAVPVWQGSPKSSTGQQHLRGAPWHLPAACKRVLSAMSFCRCSRWEHAQKIHPEILLWSQWITHILKALISLAGQTVFSDFHTRGREVASADCLGLFSDRKQRRAVGPMTRSVQTDTGNSNQISHRGKCIVCEIKNFTCLCPANPGNSSECVLNSSKSVSFPEDDLP